MSKTFLVIGSGPYSIGSSVEFDWCGVQVIRTLKKMGHKTIFVNSNPETVSTDFDECDVLYFEELTVEKILEIYEVEKPDGVIVSTGGQIAQNMIEQLADAGLPLLGTSVESIDMCEDRSKFSALCDTLGIDQPRWKEFDTLDAAFQFAEEVGFPVLVRPSFVLSGAAMAVANSPESLSKYLDMAVGSTKASVVISKFEQNAKEIEFDGVAQDGRIVCGAIAEHVENAGVHSGDATIVLPAQSLYLQTVKRVQDAAAKIVENLKISGPFNMQFLARDNEVMIIECNLRASRSFPFASKVLGQNFIELAVRIWMGEDVPTNIIAPQNVKSVGVKAAQFSFSRLKGADPLLGVEMSSTGEVACFGDTVEEAFLKSLLSVGFTLPALGTKILVTLGKMKDKIDFLSVAQKFQSLGFSFMATEGTAAFFHENGIACEVLYKVSSNQHPNILEAIEAKEVSLVINTPNKFSHEEISDGYLIRRKAIDQNIPLIINIQFAKLFAKSLEKFPTQEDLPIASYKER